MRSVDDNRLSRAAPRALLPFGESWPQHEVGVLIDGRRSVQVEERAGIVFLVDRRLLDHVAAQQPRAVEHHDLSKPARLRGC